MGPKIGDVFWADGVVCASNYVRHDEEWKRLINPKSKTDSGVDFNLSYDGIDWPAEIAKFSGDAKRNATTIGGLGVSYETFLKHHSTAGFEIASALFLFNKEKGLAYFDEWVTEVVKNLQNVLDIK